MVGKILVVSDSHGQTKELEEIKRRHEKEVDIMLHCGDSELSAEHESIKGFVSVRGNCDFEENFPDHSLRELVGKRIFLTHGHLYSVKSSLLNLLYKAKEHEADIVCFGHSHELGAELFDDVLFINPGSIRLPRGRSEKTYIIIELEGNTATVRVFDYHKGLMFTKEFSVGNQK